VEKKSIGGLKVFGWLSTILLYMYIRIDKIISNTHKNNVYRVQRHIVNKTYQIIKLREKKNNRKLCFLSCLSSSKVYYLSFSTFSEHHAKARTKQCYNDLPLFYAHQIGVCMKLLDSC
jgi:hypothetical protein